MNSSDMLTPSNNAIAELNSSDELQHSSTAKGLNSLKNSSPLNDRVKKRRQTMEMGSTTRSSLGKKQKPTTRHVSNAQLMMEQFEVEDQN